MAKQDGKITVNRKGKHKKGKKQKLGQPEQLTEDNAALTTEETSNTYELASSMILEGEIHFVHPVSSPTLSTQAQLSAPSEVLLSLSGCLL